jgi:hypothetical protein
MKVTGIEKVKHALAKLPAQIQRDVVDVACAQAAAYLAREARARCTSAHVARSIKVIRVSDKGDPRQCTYVVTAGTGRGMAGRAHLLEFGSETKNYPITPNAKGRATTNAKRVMLHAGKLLAMAKRAALKLPQGFRGKVTHPGARAKPYLRPTFDERIDAALDAFVKKAASAMEKLGPQA